MLAGGSVELRCGVSGDPPPSVYWRRQDGRMPVGRINVLPDKTLRIEQVRTGGSELVCCLTQPSASNKYALAALYVRGLLLCLCCYFSRPKHRCGYL